LEYQCRDSSCIGELNSRSGTDLQSSYVLYACAIRDRKPNPLLDFVTMVLPLLLIVTIVSARPYTFNAFILAISACLFATSRSTGLGHSTPTSEKRKERSKGEWLDESDSDEEPAEALQSATLSLSPQPTSATSSGISLTSAVPSPSMLVPETPTDQKARKRRHSPTPSTHTHTAIDILPTPEIAGPGILSSQQSSYPSPLAARLRQAQSKLPFLSVYRAHMMIMTINCILAVDFSVFPRTQGKCENFGTSLVSKRPWTLLTLDGYGSRIVRFLTRSGIY
jgi:phosphatidylinositol glycan class W